MTTINLRFLDFMDARPLPGGDVVVELTVVPRFAQILRPDRPGDLDHDPPFSGRPRPDFKPERVVLPNWSLAQRFDHQSSTDDAGRIVVNFATGTAFRELAETTDADGTAPVDVIAVASVHFTFMGFDFGTAKLAAELPDSSAGISDEIPVDFGMAALGHTTKDTTRLWFQLNIPATGQQRFRCVISPRPPSMQLPGIASTQAARVGFATGLEDVLALPSAQTHPVTFQRLDNTALLTVDELTADTDYSYQLRVDDGTREFPILTGSFRPTSGDPDHLSFSFSSCHRPVVPRNVDDARQAADQTLNRWSALARGEPRDLMVLMGDQIYGDGLENKWPDAHWFDRYQRRYRQLWAYWPMRQVLRSTPTYMILDDHDVADDFGTVELDTIRTAAALDVYRNFQHARNPGGPDGPFDFAVRRGPAAFYVLDGRTGRTPGRGGVFTGEQFDRFTTWAQSDATRDADVIFAVVTVPPALLPTELLRHLASSVTDIVDEIGAVTGATAGVLIGGAIGSIFGPAGTVIGAGLGGAVLGAVGHEAGEEVQEFLQDEIDNYLLYNADLAERWDRKENQHDLVRMLDVLFDLANGVGESQPRRRAVFLLCGDIHTGTMHLIRSLPSGNGRRHAGNPLIMQLTSSAISHPPVDNELYQMAVSRIDENFSIGLRDFSALELWQNRNQLGDLAADKLDDKLSHDPAAYALDSAGERRFWAQYAGLLMDHNVGSVDVQRVGPGRRYQFTLAIEGTDEKLRQVIDIDLENDTDEVPRLSVTDRQGLRIYLTVRQGRAGRTGPVEGVRVTVMDQDVPAPPGDDAQPPREGVHTSGPGGAAKVITTTSTDVRPPRSDETLGEGRTDRFGTLWMQLSFAERVTTAGTVVTTTTTERFGHFPGGPGPGGLDFPGRGPGGLGDVGGIGGGAGGSHIETHTTSRPLTERRPDVYFVLTMPDGRRIDTRTLDGGLFRNASGSIGSARSPAVLVVDGPPPVLQQFEAIETDTAVLAHPD